MGSVSEEGKRINNQWLIVIRIQGMLITYALYVKAFEDYGYLFYHYHLHVMRFSKR